jgi:hypothetical protein
MAPVLEEMNRLGSWAALILHSSGTGEPFAEKLDSAAPGAKALMEKTDSIAALEAPHHPKTSFSAGYEAATFQNATRS